jgi:hypothetical protein
MLTQNKEYYSYYPKIETKGQQPTITHSLYKVINLNLLRKKTPTNSKQQTIQDNSTPKAVSTAK